MICRKCRQEAPDGAFCIHCGTRQQLPPKPPKRRGNGQGSVVKRPNGKYRAVKVLGYYLDTDGKKKRRTISKDFDRKKDAVEALPLMTDRKCVMVRDLDPSGAESERLLSLMEQVPDSCVLVASELLSELARLPMGDDAEELIL